MDSNPASFKAKLFLYYYENKWLLDAKKGIYVNQAYLVIRFVL